MICGDNGSRSGNDGCFKSASRSSAVVSLWPSIRVVHNVRDRDPHVFVDMVHELSDDGESADFVRWFIRRCNSWPVQIASIICVV